MIKVDLSGAEKFFAEGGPDYAAAAKAHETLVGRTGAGADFTGWLELPRRIRDGEAFDLPDYVYDRHTIEGQRLGRGIEHFLTESAKVAPEADLGPDEALWRQAMEQELAERMKEEGEE